ncbi:MAG: radical SAM protein [Azoarcus sp.]|nr:radical SAM protein [Azoarcus sp.]
MPKPPDLSRHERDPAGFTYIYPVLSRRAGGVSVGINLNPNNACNWHCVYCQVAGLSRGKAPPIDLARLETELRAMLIALCHGDWLADNAPEGSRVVRDLAFAGNGEPSSAEEFVAAVDMAARLRDEFFPAGDSRPPLRLITNGSLLGQKRVREGIRRLHAAQGEVWFKADAGKADAIERINGVRIAPATIARNLAGCAALCRTWVQTCVFRWNGKPPTPEAISAWLAMLAPVARAIEGILLYGVARPSMQPEAVHVSPLSADELAAIAARIQKTGLTVRVSP